MILLDTNVVSEGMRRHPHANVKAWLDAQRAEELFLCTPVLAELHYGVANLPAGARRTHFEQVVLQIETGFSDRILAFDHAAAVEYGIVVAERDRRGRATGTMDALIAAIARVHRARIATRDMNGFDDLGIDLINPFDTGADR
jgi:predicted nucleic acid-binding protein